MSNNTTVPFVVLIPDSETAGRTYPIMAPPGMPGHEATALVEAAIVAGEKAQSEREDIDDPMTAYLAVCEALAPQGFVSPDWASTEGEL